MKAVKIVAFCLFLIFPLVLSSSCSEENDTVIYILMYHHVVPDGMNCNNWTITESRLREDLEWLNDHGYTTLLPSELVSRYKDGSLPERTVLLTFDDGYASNLELALPILEQTDTKAVVSLIVERIDSEKPDFLTWEMCRQLVASGRVEIGSHTYDSHVQGEGIQRREGESKADYEERIFSDLQTSIDLIERNLDGVQVRFFAYPHGIAEEWADPFIKSHFDISVTTQHGPADLSDGLYALPRLNISMTNPVSKYLPE